MFQELIEVQDELEAIEVEKQTLEQQLAINNDDLRMKDQELISFKRLNESLEEKNKDLIAQLKLNDDMVLELQQAKNELAEQRLSGGKIRSSTINLADDYIEIKHLNEFKLASEREINSLKADLKAIQDSSKSDMKKISQNEGNFKKIENDYQKLS